MHVTQVCNGHYGICLSGYYCSVKKKISFAIHLEDGWEGGGGGGGGGGMTKSLARTNFCQQVDLRSNEPVGWMRILGLSQTWIFIIIIINIIIIIFINHDCYHMYTYVCIYIHLH